MNKNLVRKLILGSVCASFPLTAIAAPTEPLRLKPASKWISDYQPDGCRLMRQFGEGDNAVILTMNRFAPTDGFGMILHGKMFKNKSPGDVSLQFGPTETEQKIAFLAGNSGKLPALISASDMRIAPMPVDQLKDIERTKAPQFVKGPPLGAAREKAVKYLQIGRPMRKPVILELGAMDKPFAALSACITDLVTSWGLDAEKHKNLVRWAIPTSNPATWMRSSDYPMDMLSAGQPALVEFRLEVDESGAATKCHIQQTTRPEEFDNAVCKAMLKKAQFQPALDAQGKPLKSYYQNTVRFQIGPKP
jgi:TonB family protein